MCNTGHWCCCVAIMAGAGVCACLVWSSCCHHMPYSDVRPTFCCFCCCSVSLVALYWAFGFGAAACRCVDPVCGVWAVVTACLLCLRCRVPRSTQYVIISCQHTAHVLHKVSCTRHASSWCQCARLSKPTLIYADQRWSTLMSAGSKQNT